MRLEGKVALVTGGGRGLGEAICRTLAREGAHIAVSDIRIADAERVANVIKQMGRKSIAIKADVSMESEVKAMVAKTIEALGTIDILVNNAGICYQGSVAEMPEEIWDKVLDVNLKGTFLCAREVMPILKQKKSGKIINLGSLAGQVGGLVVGANYSVSKAGVICFTKSLAKELAPFGINVNCIAPGVIDTEMTQPFPREEMIKTIPLKKLGEPQDVADSVLFLASQESKYITGQTISVNGGIFMG
ncbi:MAG: SDR family NAD(P)-dependent oxidoreductase [bacterium]